MNDSEQLQFLHPIPLQAGLEFWENTQITSSFLLYQKVIFFIDYENQQDLESIVNSFDADNIDNPSYYWLAKAEIENVLYTGDNLELYLDQVTEQNIWFYYTMFRLQSATNLELSLNYINKCIDLEPLFLLAKVNKCYLLYYYQTDLHTATEIVSKIPEQILVERDLILKLSLFDSQGLIEEGIAVFERNTSRLANIENAVLVASKMYSINGDQEKGLSLLNAYSNHFPFSIRINLSLGWIYYESNNYAKAKDHFELVLESAFDISELEELIMFSILADDENFFEKAISHLSEVDMPYKIGYRLIFSTKEIDNINLPGYKNYREQFGEDVFFWLVSVLEALRNYKLLKENTLH